MDRYVEVSTTTASREDAVAIGRRLVESGLAACAQIEGPLESVYTWKGEFHSEREWRCTLKTSLSLLPDLECELVSMHPYETPEFVVRRIIGLSDEYRDWIDGALRRED